MSEGKESLGLKRPGGKCPSPGVGWWSSPPPGLPLKWDIGLLLVQPSCDVIRSDGQKELIYVRHYSISPADWEFPSVVAWRHGMYDACGGSGVCINSAAAAFSRCCPLTGRTFSGRSYIYNGV